MLLYDRRLKTPPFLQELQNRSQYGGSSSKVNNNNNTTTSNNVKLHEKKDKPQIPIFQRPPSASRKISSNHQNTYNTSHEERIPQKETDIFTDGKFTHRLCCHHIIDDFTVAPNFAVRMEQLEKETKRSELCSATATPRIALDQEGEEEEEDEDCYYSNKNKENSADEKYSNQPHLTLRQIQEKRRQRQKHIITVKIPRSEVVVVAGNSQKDQEINRELEHLEHEEIRKEKLKRQNLLDSRHQDMTLSRHLGFSSELSTLQVSAAEKNYGLTVQSHDVNKKMPLRYGRQYRRNNSSPVVSSRPSSAGGRGLLKPKSRSPSPSDQVRIVHTRPTSTNSILSNSSNTKNNPSFFLTNPNARLESKKNTDQYYRELGIYDVENDITTTTGNDVVHAHNTNEKYEDLENRNDLVERRLQNCMESKKIDLRPSSANDRRTHTEQHERTKTGVYKMTRAAAEIDSNGIANDEVENRSDEDDDEVLEKLFKSGQKPSSATTIPSAPSSRPTSARIHGKNYIIIRDSANNKRPHSASSSTVSSLITPRPPSASSASSSVKNKWLPDGALSNLMIKKSKYNNNSSNKDSQSPRATSTTKKINVSARKNLGRKESAPQSQQKAEEETLDEVLSTPRGRNKNSSYDPLYSSKRANSDRSCDIGSLTGQKLLVPSTRGIFKN